MMRKNHQPNKGGGSRIRTALLSFAGAAAVAAAVGVPAMADDGTTTADLIYMLFIALAVVLGIAVIASIIVLVMRMRKRAVTGPVATRNALWNTVLGALTVVCVVVAIVANWATSTYSASLDNVMTKLDTSAVSTDTTEDDWYDLVDEIGDEGMVLMRNENDALPLHTTKVNLLGYDAYNPYYSGGGSGDVTVDEPVSIIDSLTDAGIEINDALEESGIYDEVDPTSEGIGNFSVYFEIYEPDISEYTGDISFESMAEYSDTAIVVLGRNAGEGADLTMYEDGDNYLELGDNERALLEQASETFDTVIVVINSANALEMDFLDEYDVDACIWASLPGPYGFASLGRILTGEVNPSGRLVDTWAYDNYSNPVSENYGDQEASNYEGSHYVDYVEGIYVGYKWYETAYAEGAVITNTDTGVTYDYGNDYDSIVAFPFGYGLSYTTFSQEIVGGLDDGDALDPTGSISIEVEVTNTGDVAGKEVVQVYLTAPYTDYDIENGVEKSEVSLVGFAKTDELEPGESQTVTVDIDVEDIASYDSSYDNGDGTYGSYMLDAGDYVFSIRENAHTAIDDVTATLDESYFYSGDNKRSTDDQAAYNQFDDASRGVYLSRYNAFENYEEAMESVSTEVESTAFEEDPGAYDESYDEGIDEMVEGVDYAVDGDLTLDDVAGLDYDDEQWDELISQLTIEEMQTLVEDAMYSSPQLDSISKLSTSDTDGPLGMSSMFNPDLNGVPYPSVPLIAATFNVEIAEKFGNQMADQCHSSGITGWYAPAMDIHRWAYSGRNFEYYSEDGFLSGAIGFTVVAAANDKGLITYIKHFALNDQETNRASRLHTYSNEQAIREIYLKPFEMSVKDGGATAVMSSMNFIGDMWAGAHEGLLTEVLRNEWGFHGKVLTDMAEDSLLTEAVDAAMRAGNDAWLSVTAVEVSGDTAADIYYLQRTAHNILYMEANAVTIGAEILNWNSWVVVITVELGLLAAILVVALILRNRKPKSVTTSGGDK